MSGPTSVFEIQAIVVLRMSERKKNVATFNDLVSGKKDLQPHLKDTYSTRCVIIITMPTASILFREIQIPRESATEFQNLFEIRKIQMRMLN